ncbi:bicaudal-D-related protein 2-like [Electrophorus electricus]|uniref:bicaudal-D-related protein 2-like n=1 Tax=Electrophorus electricus TaxID=8005 RepID=UPI0015D075F1|nr:bicaudal-D-related protein 2-like [Electrophorus electricus]
MEQIQLQITSEDDPNQGCVSPMEEDNLPHTNRNTLSLPLSMLDERQEHLRADKESESSIVTDQADGIERLTLNSSPGPSLNKPIQSYLHEVLPDLLRSGSPLRRRVSSPVSDTLKQMRREVELSRRRSLKIKAQVDRLQEQSQDGLAWSQQRERVAEEIQSIVKLLLPLTDLEPAAEPVSQDSPIDAALLQLQNVARTLAFNHTAHRKNKDGKVEDDGVVLQQALRDRDDALAKKKAMESELLKSKTELMLLNNQLLEAVQSRLDMAIELEAWKDDVQTILHHHVLSQQQAEQAQKKPKGFSALRRSKQYSPVQSPSPSRASTTAFQSPNTPVVQRWKERLRRGRTLRPSSDTFNQSVSSSPSGSQTPGSISEDSFQTISLT